MQAIDHASVNTLRFLAADQVEKAKSGHPGFPLGTAPLMYTLWDRFMRYNPKDPNWFNRDRSAVLSRQNLILLWCCSTKFHPVRIEYQFRFFIFCQRQCHAVCAVCKLEYTQQLSAVFCLALPCKHTGMFRIRVVLGYRMDPFKAVTAVIVPQRFL